MLVRLLLIANLHEPLMELGISHPDLLKVLLGVVLRALSPERRLEAFQRQGIVQDGYCGISIFN